MGPRGRGTTTTSPVVAIPEIGGNESLDELVRKLLG